MANRFAWFWMFPLRKDSGKEVKKGNPVGGRDFVFFTYAGKGNKEYFLLPANFDLRKHLEQYPPYENGFPRDKKFNEERIYEFLSLIASIPARSSDLIDEQGFVPITMKILRDSDKDFTRYKYYLLHTGVVLTDGRYIIGEKSTGYKWADEYANVPFELRKVDSTLADEIKKYEKSPDKEDYPYLFHWYDDGGLIIDATAESYAYLLKEIKMRDASRESWNINKDTGKRKYPVTQYYAALLNIGRIEQKQYQAHIDENIHRLHSVLTNLQKDFRNFVTYKGQNLTSVDVKNCQPYLSCLILNPLFWNDASDLPLKFSDLPENIRNYFPEVVLGEIQAFFERVNADDFKEYIQKASDGGMYEDIAEVANKKINPKRVLVRQDAKTLMFYMLFSSNGGQHDNPEINQMKRIFEQELYPEVAELFRIIKKKHRGLKQENQHNRLAVLLQAIESQIMLHRCCKRIWEEKKGQMPIYTIHDSIVTLSEDAKYVQKVMAVELTFYVGVEPKLALEEWHTDNLNQNILAQTKKMTEGQ